MDTEELSPLPDVCGAIRLYPHSWFTVDHIRIAPSLSSRGDNSAVKMLAQVLYLFFVLAWQVE